MIGNALRLRSGHDLRKVYFRFWQNGTPAGVPFCHFHKKGRRDKMHFSVTAPLVKKRLERSAELVGAKPLHLLTQTALPLKSPTGAFIATLRSANAVVPNAKLKMIFPLKMPRVQRRRPPPAAETGRSCWGSGQQDASAAQGTKRMLGAATRKKRSAF